jgi:ABC-type transporter Mla subunit MlaD
MIAIYFLISIFTLFSPQNIWLPAHTGPSQVVAHFEDLQGISRGAAVLLDGHLIGQVSSIKSQNSDLDEKFAVALSIAPNYRALLKQGTIALIKSPLSFSRTRPEPVIELLVPKERNSSLLSEGAKITGFSSFQKFWSADLSSYGVPEKAFESTLS